MRTNYFIPLIIAAIAHIAPLAYYNSQRNSIVITDSITISLTPAVHSKTLSATPKKTQFISTIIPSKTPIHITKMEISGTKDSDYFISPSTQSGSHSENKFLVYVDPVYPRFAREKGFEGEVSLSAKYSALGQVTEVTITKSSGYRLLDESAKQAAIQWKISTDKSGQFEKKIFFKLKN